MVAGLDLLSKVEHDARLAAGHRLPAGRGHLLELAGDVAEAAADYEAAARLTTSLRERDYPRRRAITGRSAAVRRTAPPG